MEKSQKIKFIFVSKEEKKVKLLIKQDSCC